MSKSEQDINFKSLFVPFTNLKATVIIFIIGFVSYFNMLFNGFVWDNLAYIIGNNKRLI
jgi:hypothetical protein